MTQPTRAITPAAIPPASALERAVGTVDNGPCMSSKLKCINYIAEQLVIPVVITIVLCNIISYVIINVRIRIRQKWGHFAVMCCSVGSVRVDQVEMDMGRTSLPVCGRELQATELLESYIAVEWKVCQNFAPILVQM